MYFHFEDKDTPISVRTFEDLSPMPHLHHHLEVGLLQKEKPRAALPTTGRLTASPVTFFLSSRTRSIPTGI